MVQRKTIRPVTLRRVIEICSLAAKLKVINVKTASEQLNISVARAKEVLQEIERMGLLIQSGEAYAPNNKTTKLLSYFENQHWNGIHEYFLRNYLFYKNFIRLLEDHVSDSEGLSIDEIKEESKNRQLQLNQTAIEVLSDWCDRLEVIQRHLYSNRLYLIKNETDPENFRSALVKCYEKLSSFYGRKGVFVEIPKIREDICEQLKINRKLFDEMLRQTYLRNIGIIELSGAPIITLAKKSPLSEKKMRLIGKQVILSPKFEITRERNGLVVGRRAYYYLAIHEEV
jgi:Mn-dependent DtxR family transcriptional regulator